MRDLLLPVVFWAMFAMAGLAVVIAAWVAFGTLGQSEGRDLNSAWATASRRYKPLMIAFLTLLAAIICLALLGEWLRRHA